MSNQSVVYKKLMRSSDYIVIPFDSAISSNAIQIPLFHTVALTRIRKVNKGMIMLFTVQRARKMVLQHTFRTTPMSYLYDEIMLAKYTTRFRPLR